MSEIIYIFGHKSPDADSIIGAISFAQLKNKLENTDKYLAVIPAPANRETKFVLEKFGFEEPRVLESVSGQNVILVDHNEFVQSIAGIEEAKIVEVLDHHKVDFKYADPIEFNVKPWGASCTIIAQMFFDKNIAIDKKLAGLMLSAILVDTVITKSPTCTAKDKEVIEKLSQLAEVENWQDLGMEIFKVRSSIGELSAAEIIKSDFKDFNFKAGKFGIGQVETVDLGEYANREDELLSELNKLKQDQGYHSVVLFITDIIKEGSQFLVATDNIEEIEKATDAKFDNNRAYIPGILSRKKQVAPKFTEAFDK